MHRFCSAGVLTSLDESDLYVNSHQWMFITDTVDAVYPPENWTPQAIMDRLGEIVGGRQDLLTKRASLTPKQPQPGTNGFDAIPGTTAAARPSRPLLSNLRQSRITTLASLEPFFSRASLSNYEAVYALGGVDLQAVEASVEMDLFEGDE